MIPIPTSFDEAYNAKSWPEYAAAISDAGGEPIPVPLTHTPAELQSLVDHAAAILLPGSGADIDPNRYGHPRDAASAPPDLLREATDRAILEAAESTSKPVLGICLGLQSLNVYYGGTLIQDLSPMPVNHRAGRAVNAAHAVELIQDSRLGSALCGNSQNAAFGDMLTRMPVNSSHHQAVGMPGDSLRAVARCPEDGVIEALEGTNSEHWLVGVQWHPERTVGESSASRALFTTFVQMAASSWPS